MVRVSFIPWVAVIAGVALVGQTGGPKTFSTPEEARDALVQSAASGADAVKILLGPGSEEIIRSGDAVQDKILLDRFNARAAQKAQLVAEQTDPDHMTLEIGAEELPFAIPLIRKNGRWYWDVQAGKAEVRYRIIGGNELDAIQVCRGFVDAEELYAQTDWDGDGIFQYARHLISSPGKKDGLYWPGNDSPVAEPVAKASAEGYPQPTGAGRPYHGYLYKILTAQGQDSDGGARDYVVHGFMIGGFALVAWPAEYGVSGIKTFIVNQDGVVFEKDLGPQTSALVKAMTIFNADKSWALSPPDVDDVP